MKRLFQASPKGACSGVAVACAGDLVLTIAVVPKLWSSGPRHHVIRWPTSAENLSLCVAELDTVELSGTEEQLLVLDEYFDSIREATKPSLLEPIRRVTVPAETTSGQGADVDEAIGSLDALCRVTGLGSLLGQNPATWAVAQRSKLLRPLLVRGFVDEVASAIRTARRGYVWMDEILPSVRGRVDAASVVINQATGWPQLRCSYQDFNRDTDLMRVIVSALSTAALEPRPASTWETMWAASREIAIALRRQLEDVREVPRAQAYRVAARLRLGSFDQSWASAVSLATLVLLPASGVSTRSAGGGSAEFLVETSRSWECILRDALSGVGVSDLTDLNRGDQSPLSLSRPWSSMQVVERQPRPDLLFRTAAGWWVMDAKYKRLGAGMPSIEDQYQVFAYSHLAQPVVPSLALAYPQSERGLVRKGPYFRSIEPSCSLWVDQIQFPTPYDVVTRWHEYLKETAALLAPGLTAAQPH